MSRASGTRFNTYLIGESIGVGGMGEVYRATDTNLNRDVALNVLPDGRFVLVRNSIEDKREIVVVLNWFDEVRRLAPAAPAQP